MYGIGIIHIHHGVCNLVLDNLNEKGAGVLEVAACTCLNLVHPYEDPVRDMVIHSTCVHTEPVAYRTMYVIRPICPHRFLLPLWKLTPFLKIPKMEGKVERVVNGVGAWRFLTTS